MSTWELAACITESYELCSHLGQVLYNYHLATYKINVALLSYPEGILYSLTQWTYFSLSKQTPRLLPTCKRKQRRSNNKILKLRLTSWRKKSLKQDFNLIFFIYTYINQPTSFYYGIKDLILETSPAELCNKKDGQLTGPFRPFIDNWPRTDALSAYGLVRGELHGVCNVHVYYSSNLSFYIVCSITHIISKVVTPFRG